MNLELAIVLSCDETGCLVQPLDAAEPLHTAYSSAVKDQIRIRRGEVVAIDRDAEPVQLVWRWRRSEVLELRGEQAVIGACGICVEAKYPEGLELNVGDEVLTVHKEMGKEILDRMVEGRPEHPERLRMEAFPVIERTYRDLATG